MPSLVKRIRSRFGIAAPRMTVRTHVAWYWRWLGLIVVGALSLALAAWIYDAGRRFAGFDSSQADEELRRLRDAHVQLEKEAAGLRAVVNASDARIKIEQSAQARLVEQLRQMGEENNRLKEDLALYDGFNPGERRDERVAIQRFVVEKGDSPGHYRYRLLVVQGGRRDHDYQGSLQILVGGQGEGRNAMIPVQEDGLAPGEAHRLNFRLFQRQAGTFSLPAGVRARSVQVKVFESGSAEPRATQSASMPQDDADASKP
jgi:hypothetical protein